MSNITFVKTRHVYESYLDFWRLVKLSGFSTIYVDEVDVSKYGVFIVCPCNGEWRPHIDNQADRVRNAHLVLWNLERPSGSAGSVGNYAKDNRELINKRQIDEIWVSDRRLADETNLRFVVLGSHPKLGYPGDEKKYQFCHMSYETGRRTGIYKHFDKAQIGPNCWPPQRHQVLQQSKFAVNIHQDNHPFQEPLRFALFAAYGLPIISETIYDVYPWGDSTMKFSSWDGMSGKIKQMLGNDYARWKQFGLGGRKLMTETYNFRKVVEQALEESIRSWR